MKLNLSQESWEDLKSKLRKKYPQLTESDLQHTKGMEENMLRMIEYKLRKTKKEMNLIIATIGFASL
jgi:hypothetical protein